MGAKVGVREIVEFVVLEGVGGDGGNGGDVGGGGGADMHVAFCFLVFGPCFLSFYGRREGWFAEAGEGSGLDVNIYIYIYVGEETTLRSESARRHMRRGGAQRASLVTW